MTLAMSRTRNAAAAARTAGRLARRNPLVRAVYRYGVRTVGRRFTRFAFGSALALAASEITLVACLAAHAWPTISAAAGWFAGALVSYILSRWAWERRGRPHLLKETLPFWVIAGCTIVVLSVATSMAHHLALTLGLAPAARLAFDGAAYLAANTLTFLARFVILNYLLFADRHPSAGQAGTASPGRVPPAEPTEAHSSGEPVPNLPAGASVP
jgi:putative flippase GtrA